MYDVLIKNGTVVNGTGKRKPYVADVAIQGDLIAAVAPGIEHSKARLTVDAGGKTVIPGFVDPHVHEEWVLFTEGLYEIFLQQGVTTVVNGNCGHSMFPGPKKNIIDYYTNNGLMSFRQQKVYYERFPEWNDFREYADAAEKKGTNLNFVTLLGHGTIRQTVMGGAFPRKPDTGEWAAIERIIRHNMEQGAWGISYGLDYVPSRYASIDELVRVTKIIMEYDGISAAHLRHYAGIIEAVEEFLEVARRTGARIQISHLKSASPEAFELARKAIESEGIRARIDTIPRSTGHCISKPRLVQFILALSDELFDKGPEGVKAALQTPEGRELIKKDAYIFAGDKEDKFIVCSDDPELENRSVADIARSRGIDPDECMLDLIADEKSYVFWLGGPSRKDFAASGHSPEIVANPYVSVGSDEIKGDIEIPFDWYELQRRGSFPNFLNEYLDKGVVLEEIVRRNTTMVCEHFGIQKRGRLEAGYFADISVIDLPRYKYPQPDQMHYKTPQMTASGVEHVFVNGIAVLAEGKVLPAYSGRVLSKR